MLTGSLEETIRHQQEDLIHLGRVILIFTKQISGSLEIFRFLNFQSSSFWPCAATRLSPSKGIRILFLNV